MTFTVNYTNILDDYTEANRHHSGGNTRRGIWLIIILFLSIWLITLLVASPAPTPGVPAPAPPTLPPPSLLELLFTLTLDTLPWVAIAGFLAIIFSLKPKPPKRPPPLKIGSARHRRLLDFFPTFVLLALAGIFLLGHILIGFFLALAHRDGSAPAFYESPLRILPWMFIVIFLWTALIRRGIKTNWLKQTHLQLPQLLTFTDDSVTVHNSNVHSIYQWHTFNKCLETPTLFMLYISGLSFLMVPKRSLATPTEMDAFRAFIHSHIFAPSSAFPVLPVAPPVAGPAPHGYDGQP